MDKPQYDLNMNSKYRLYCTTSYTQRHIVSKTCSFEMKCTQFLIRAASCMLVFNARLRLKYSSEAIINRLKHCISTHGSATFCY